VLIVDTFPSFSMKKMGKGKIHRVVFILMQALCLVNTWAVCHHGFSHLQPHHLMEAGHFCFSELKLVGKPKGKRPLGRPRHRWVDNIRMDLGGVGWGDVDRWRALVNSVLSLRVP
jgi:hypothetical protein